VAAGTIIGGPVGDRIGRKRVIWVSILGAAPFALALPHANLLWTAVLSVPIGLILGFAFGMGGIGSAVLGELADHTSIEFVFSVCAYLPLLGLLTGFLPDVEGKRK
jgi:FSR family fosmidomycin resistance protein-like MFS transporter